MKRIILILAFGIFQIPFVRAQKTTDKSTIRPEIVVDTISAGSSICLEPAVTHFTASVTGNGKNSTVYCNGHCGSSVYESGDVVIIDNIASTGKNGERKKLPPRKYVVL